MYNARQLPVPVPPMLEEAIGYDGEARYVTFHWQRAGDEVIVDDGQRSYDANWHAYLTFMHHPRIFAALGEFNFGSSEDQQTHRLLLDRHARTLAAVPEVDAHQVLRDQYPPQHHNTEPVRIEDWAAFTKALNDRMQAAMRDPLHQRHVMEQMAKEQQLTRDLLVWLDAPN